MIDVKTLNKSVRSKKVLIDSNIIIYLTEETEPYYHLSQELFSMLEEGDCNAVQVLVLKPARLELGSFARKER